MRAAVVIPTRDRPAALRRCLAAVRGQTGVELEVVVVDDGSRSPERVVAVAREFDARLVRLEGEGPAAARNAGVAEADAEVVLLLDDDCIARAGWAGALVAAALSAPLVVAAGEVLVPSGANVWLRASERIAVEAEVASRFVRTINLACRREILLDLPFDERFRSAAGEDRDWCVRAERAGVSFVRVPGIGVEHAAASDATAFLRQHARYGRALRLLRRKGTHVPMSGRALRRSLGAGFGESPAVGLAMVAAQAATAVGIALEWSSPAPR